jgi:hypothetical protein
MGRSGYRGLVILLFLGLKPEAALLSRPLFDSGIKAPICRPL